MYKGIDISTHNTITNWCNVKAAGIDFAIIREGFGEKSDKQVDAKFHKHIAAAKQHNINCGVYHYSYATSVKSAINEAEFCLENIKDYQLEYPVAFDIEDPSLEKLSTSLRTDICKAFCETIEEAGYYVMIYSSLYWFRDLLKYDELSKKYDIWLAQWNTNKPSITCGIWQYVSSEKINGCEGLTDVNISYKDYPTIMKTKHLNKF